MPTKDTLIRFAQLKLEVAKIEAELEMLKATALDELRAIRGDANAPVQLSEFPGFSFSIQKRKIWTYSPVVVDLKSRLDTLKHDEEATGDATYEEKEVLFFNAPRE